MKKNILKFIPFFALALVAIFLTGCMGIHEHNISQWHTETAATCTSPEILVRECNSCDYIERKQGESAKGHKYTAQVIAPTEVSNGYTAHTCGNCYDVYHDNYKSLISFESVASVSSIPEGDLPTFNSAIINTGTQFSGVTNTGTLRPVSYALETTSGKTTLNVGDRINNSGKIIITWDYITAPKPSTEEVAFNALIEKIEKLEELSNAYNTANSLSVNPQLRVMQYIRNGRYTGSTWNMVCGTMESDFAAYVNSNQGSINVASLQSIDTFVIPKTGESVDFVHMFATLNALVKGSGSYFIMSWTGEQAGDLGGWGGDLCQLASDVKTSSLSGTYSDKANSLFMASSGFGAADVYADLDAVNIFAIYNAMSTKSISSAMKSYYASISTSSRKTAFKTNNFSSLNTSSEDKLAEGIISRLSSNALITMWCASSDLDFTKDAEIFLACAKTFAKYVLTA